VALNRSGNPGSSDLPWVPESRHIGYGATGWWDDSDTSSSIGVSIPIELCRRRLWKISKYSKMTSANSMRSSTFAGQEFHLHAGPEDLDHRIVMGINRSAPSEGGGSGPWLVGCMPTR
jgi:hypothetical protein